MIKASDLLDMKHLSMLSRIVTLWIPLGYHEPFPPWIRIDNYYILETRGRCGRDNKMLPSYLVFRVQHDPEFGWYFKKVDF